jgi:quercetin dioxygenase-like cupin family protein
MKVGTWTKFALAAGFTALLGCVPVALSQPDARGFVRLSPDEVKWVAYPGLGGELGMQQAVLYGDPAKPGVYIVRVRFPKGVMGRPHSHPDDRMAVVLKGTWWTGTSETWDPSKTTPVGVGGYMMHPKGQVHFDGAKDEEVIVQVVGFGPSGKKSAHPNEPDFTKQ